MGNRGIARLMGTVNSLEAGYKKTINNIKDVENEQKSDISTNSEDISNQKPLGCISKNIALDCLSSQWILNGVPRRMIKKIYKKGMQRSFEKGEVITEQDAPGDVVYFILQGKVAVKVLGRIVAERYAKECVGEMSVLDPTQRRSATLVATEHVEVLELSYEIFNDLLMRKPKILKNLAIILSERLRERSKFFKTPNKVLNIFIGSSSEGMKIANEFKEKLIKKFNENGRQVEVNVWNEKTFLPSQSNLESLVDEAQRSDFAIFVLTSDDRVFIREEEKEAPRDNVVFELGLFMGCIGRDRTYALASEKELSQIRIPTDLNGITQLRYDEVRQQNSVEETVKCYDFTKAISMIFDKSMDKGVRL